MTNAIAKKIIAAALAVSTITGTQAMTVTATVGTALTASAFATTPAEAAGQCGARISISGLPARGAVYALRKTRAERRAKRAWRAFITGQDGTLISDFTNTGHASFGLGSRYADLDNARNVIINCKGSGIAKMRCTVSATPCTAGSVAKAQPAPRKSTSTLRPLVAETIIDDPDLSRTWNSDFGPINWKEGYYGNPNKTLTGQLVNRNGTMVYEGHWGRRDSAARGTVRFVFSDHGRRFTGTYRASNGQTKTWNGYR